MLLTGRMDNIIIEKARAEDVDFIKKLEVECDLCSWSKEDYLQEIAGNNDLFLVAKRNRELIGFIIARLIMIETKRLVEYEAEIYNIAVKREYRRAAIASRLIDKLIETGIRNNLKEVYLEVRESNHSARKFYSKSLFKVVGKRKNFYTDPSENAILMCRRLSEEKNM